MSGNEFKPAWWLRNSHLQTLWPVFLRPDIKDVLLERERVELPDGDFIDLDWVGRHRCGPTVLILPGFEGSIESHYAKGMLRRIELHGWRGVFMHFRGCSGEPNRLPRSYHSGETTDVAYITQLLRQQNPSQPIAAIGYSLGGNVLLKWLGETGQANPLQAAIAVSVPFELQKVANCMQNGLTRCYQWYFLKCLRERISDKLKVSPTNLIAVSDLDNVASLVEFDDKYTAPLHGFDGVEDYYAKASSRQYLRAITKPTLIVHSKDDPLMSHDVIPAANELSPHIQLEVTRAGGHVGFVTGSLPWRPEYWLEQRIPEFLKHHF